MRKVAILALLLASVWVFSVLSREDGVGGSDFHKNDITYSREVVTPHVRWASKLPGGPIKAFFIPSIKFGRDMVELMQRLDLAPTTVSIDREWDINCWGIGDYYGHEPRGDKNDFQVVYGYVEKDLAGPAPFEVMVIPGLNGWSRMTRATRDAILRRVNDGAGLVLIHPFVGDVKGNPFRGDEKEGDTRIWEVSPLVNSLDDLVSSRGYPEVNKAALTRGAWQVAKEHFITSGQALDLLPDATVGGSLYKYQPAGEMLIRAGEYPVLAVKRYGKGRVVALAYQEEGFIPKEVDPVETGIYWDFWEYYYSLLARTVLWASGRESTVSFRSLVARPDAGTALGLTLLVSSPIEAEIAVTSRSEFGHALTTYLQSERLTTGEIAVSIPAAVFTTSSGGKEIFDVIVRDKDKQTTLEWGNATFQSPKRATLTLIKPATDVYRQGDTLSVALRAAGNLSDLAMKVRITDDLDRLVHSQVLPARGERYFLCPLEHFIGRYAFVTAELVEPNGGVVDQLRAKPVMVVQKDRRIREYTPLVSFGGSRHFLKTSQTRQVRNLASDLGFTWGELLTTN